jgi:N-acetylglucosaminyl-diphospho-decaprenol L-rhamnosyltransferase
MDESQPQGPAQPRVSALVLSYNAAASLRRSLAALEKSAPRELLQIIVMENGSQDESPQLDAEFPDVTFMKLARNFGATKAFNIGTRTAAGEYIFYLSPEIEVLPDTVAKLAARLDADETAVAVCPLLVTPTGEPIAQAWKLPGPDLLSAVSNDPEALPVIRVDPMADAAPVEYASGRAILARKFFVKALNYFDERYGHFGWDLELAYQIRRAQRRILILPGVRATAHEPEQPPLSSSQRAAISADRVLGVSRFAAKHYGFMAGLKVRGGAALASLARMATLRDPAFQFNRLAALMTGQKIDGSQSAL